MSKAKHLTSALVILAIGAGLGYAATTMSSDEAVEIAKSDTPSQMIASGVGTAIWQFPDLRALDPAIFGTPAEPRGISLLPLAKRATNEVGDAWTTTKGPVMISNKIKKTSGSINLSVADLTAMDAKNSLDQATVEAKFDGPNGEKFRVVLKKLIPVGPDHPFFGGVGTNILMHGSTGIGGVLVPRELSYITLWGLGDLYRDSQLIDSKRIIHVMVSERIRDDAFKIGFGVARPDQLEIHLALPPVKGSPTGPIASPVPTGIILPNGKEQPFIHVNFYDNIKLENNKFL